MMNCKRWGRYDWQRDCDSAGFTLLEVILALSLSVMVIAAIAAAVRLHLIVLENQRAEIERAQLGRAILQMVANDVRAAIQYKPADVSGLEELAASQAAMLSAFGGSGGLPSSSSQEGLASGGSGSFGSSSSADESVIPRPGLYGNASQLIVDISRLPRLDQYLPELHAESQAISLPSDIKRVSYYVSQQSRMGTGGTAIHRELNLRGSVMGGLYRSEVDRAVATYFLTYGGGLDGIAREELIAPEVAAIEFRYFDGSQWLDAWDSDLENGFPSAVEIVVIVDSAWADPARNAVGQFDSFDTSTMRRFRTVVYLPIAETGQETPMP